MSSSPQKVKPSVAAAILVPLAIWIVVGAIGGALIAVGISKIPAAVDDLQRVPIGEPTEVELEAGDYRVFIEGSGVNDAFIQPASLVGLVDAEGNEVPVDVYSSSTSLTYDVGGHEGRAAWTFEVDTGGTYTITAGSDDAIVDGIAFGTENPVTAGVPFVIGGVVVGTLGFVIAVIVMIVMLVRRGRAKRNAFQAAAYSSPPTHPQGGWGPGYQ